jgi:hypothetical protein
VVHDSDFAFLGGVGPDGRAFELLVGESYEADGYLDRLAAPEGRREAAQALSAWSETNARRHVQPKAVLRILDAELVFAEVGILGFFAEPGLPMRTASSSSSEPGGRWVDSLACGASPATLSGARKRTKR